MFSFGWKGLTTVTWWPRFANSINKGWNPEKWLNTGKGKKANIFAPKLDWTQLIIVKIIKKICNENKIY